MQEIAQDIYDSTPGINDEIPRQTSKILQNVKNNKKGAAGAG
jgi:chromosome segregation ATPase